MSARPADLGDNDGPQVLRIGMLLWEPRKEPLAGQAVGFAGSVWCVKSVGARSARLIMAADTLQAEATVRGNTVPFDWRVIDNRKLWYLIEGVADE